MGTYSFSASELVKRFKTEEEIFVRGRELRERGYKLHWHMIWGYSVEIPSSREQLNETQMKVRYDNSNNQPEFEDAFEYLILCRERLCKLSGLTFSLS